MMSIIAIKTEWDENDKEASSLMKQPKRKKIKRTRRVNTGMDLSADAPLTSQNTLEGKSIIDRTTACPD